MDTSSGEQSPSSQPKRGETCAKNQGAKGIKVKGPASGQFHFNHCQAQLRRRYSTMSQVKITPWNPNDTVHINEVYTNLSWLRDDKTPHGTTLEKLEDYSMVFKGHKQFKKPKRILVYGRPRIGKTTFSQKLSVDWSNGEKQILKKFDLLLTIKLRDVCNINDFGDVLKAASLLADDDVISADSLHKYVCENQERVLIVLDGYDEYSAGESSDVNKIWKGSLLRDCCVVMTTRPTEDDEVKMSSDVQCRIRGFDSKEQVKEFASKFVNEREVTNLENYLSNENIWDIAEIPLLLLMLCLIWREKHLKRLPKSRLELYERFVETILYHMVVKESGKSAERDILDLYRDELTRIGKLALEALLRDNVYISRKHLDTQSNNLSEPMIKAGFFQISKLYSAVPEESIFFLHKSIQEFLAAWFVMHGGETESVSSIDSLDKISKLDEILKFMCQWSVCGARSVFRLLRLIGEKERLTAYDFTMTPPSIDDLPEEQSEFISISLDCLLWCPVSDREAVLPLFLECNNYVLILNEEWIPIAAKEHLLESTTTFSLPTYVFFTCKCDTFRGDIIKSDDIFSIMRDLNTAIVLCSGKIRTVERYMYADLLTEEDFFLKKEGQQMLFYLTSIFEPPTKLLTELISAPLSPFQKPVDVLSNNQDNSRALDLTENVPEQTRHHCLSFVRDIEIHGPTNEYLMVMNNVLPFVTSPRKLFIKGSINVTNGAELIESMVSFISFTDKLHSLTLERINLTAKCATEIARSLQQAPNLHKLNLSFNSLYSAVSDLAVNLHHVPQLTELNLREVHMRYKECELLATLLKDVKKLQVLDLSYNPLGHGIIELAEHLHCVSHLTELRLDDTQMGEEEVSALARALKYVPELEHLYLGSNPLGRGVIDLIKHLSSIPKLMYMYLELFGVKMTKKEAEELCTAVRGTNIELSTDYHARDEMWGGYRLRTEAELKHKPNTLFADA
ncbi:hypothetical protein ACROYT_G016658 [Oculina patagonica]